MQSIFGFAALVGGFLLYQCGECTRLVLYYRIAGGFRGHLFSRISQISASRENIFSEILGATPSSRSVPTCFGLIAKIFFTKITPVSNSRKYRSAKKPGYTVYCFSCEVRWGAHTVLRTTCSVRACIMYNYI